MSTSWWRSSVGQKAIVALSGIVLLGFIVAHLLGNLLIFAGPAAINGYAKKLRDLGPWLWVLRAGLLTAFIVHITASIQVSRQNRKARASRYHVYHVEETNWAARTMLASGLLLAAYIVYHLLHFTFQKTDPSIAHLTDAYGNHDVYRMVVLGLQNVWVSGIYMGAMGLLCAHLYHGFESVFQSLGWNNDRFLPRFQFIGRAVAWVIFLGYVSVPASILLGWVTLR